MGIAIDPKIGKSIGLSTGIGIMNGTKNDAEAKKIGRVI